MRVLNKNETFHWRIKCQTKKCPQITQILIALNKIETEPLPDEMPDVEMPTQDTSIGSTELKRNLPLKDEMPDEKMSTDNSSIESAEQKRTLSLQVKCLTKKCLRILQIMKMLKKNETYD